MKTRLSLLFSTFCMVLLAAFAPKVHAASAKYTFSAFTTSTITGGGSAYTKSLDVSGLSATEYLCYNITAEFVPGTNSAWSQTINLELNNGASTVYKSASTASSGSLASSASTTLIWSGVLASSYTGGNNLTVKILDSFNDASGPYTSSLANVTVTLYPLTPTKHTFATFNTGQITGAGAAFSKSLDVSSLPASEYIFLTVSANYVSTGGAWSSTMQMGLTNGASITHWASTTATSGPLNSTASTTLVWTGVLARGYIGGNALTINFLDPVTDGGGPYYSELNNVTVTISPCATPKHTFPTFNTTPITGGGSAYTKSLDVSALPASEYFCISVTADYVPGTSPHDAWSSTMTMSINDGASTVYKSTSGATFGVLPGAGSTSLVWTGLFSRIYTSPGNLSISFLDAFTDASGPYTSTLNNVSVTIYPIEPVTYTVSGSLGALGSGATLSYMDGSAKTATADGSGNYSFTVSYNWSGTVTPSLTGYSFSPTSRTYTNVIADQSAQNYTTTADPTVVSLTSFTAKSRADQVLLAWSTGSEVDEAGFNLWRASSANGVYVKLNAALIPARGISPAGTSYLWTDSTAKPGETWFYMLEDVDSEGVGTMHGPISASPVGSAILTFTATPASLFRQGTALLSWTTEGVSALTLNGLPILGSSLWVSPTSTTSYLLSDGIDSSLLTLSVKDFSLIDMSGLAKSWGSAAGEAAYDPCYDLNGDGRVDDQDVEACFRD